MSIEHGPHFDLAPPAEIYATGDECVVQRKGAWGQGAAYTIEGLSILPLGHESHTLHENVGVIISDTAIILTQSEGAYIRVVDYAPSMYNPKGSSYVYAVSADGTKMQIPQDMLIPGDSVTIQLSSGAIKVNCHDLSEMEAKIDILSIQHSWTLVSEDNTHYSQTFFIPESNRYVVKTYDPETKQLIRMLVYDNVDEIK